MMTSVEQHYESLGWVNSVMSTKPQNFDAGKLVKRGYKICLTGCGQLFWTDMDLILHSQHCEVKYELINFRKFLKTDPMAQKLREEDNVKDPIIVSKSPPADEEHWKTTEKTRKGDKLSKEKKVVNKDDTSKILDDLPVQKRSELVHEWLFKHKDYLESSGSSLQTSNKAYTI